MSMKQFYRLVLRTLIISDSNSIVFSFNKNFKKLSSFAREEKGFVGYLLSQRGTMGNDLLGDTAVKAPLRTLYPGKQRILLISSHHSAQLTYSHQKVVLNDGFIRILASSSDMMVHAEQARWSQGRLGGYAPCSCDFKNCTAFMVASLTLLGL